MRRQADAPPPLALCLSETGRAVAEYGMFLGSGPVLRRLPKGDSHPVLVLPGLLGDDTSTGILRRLLRRLDYAVYGWGLGRNIGPTELCLDGLPARLDELHRRYQQPVSLVGWSLGGILARQLARKKPDAVRQVITLGSPFRLAHHSQSRSHFAYELFTSRHVETRTLPLEQDDPPLRMPATAIYSPVDGIVNWRTCLNLPGARTENIAVLASHMGLGHHPAALWAIGDRLAQPATAWKPFRPPAFLRLAFPAFAKATGARGAA